MRCSKCGCESTLERLFKPHGKSLVWRRGRPGFATSFWCPECIAREVRLVRNVSIVASILSSALLVWAAMREQSRPTYDFGSSLAWLININLLLAFLCLCIIPHELGHVLGAWLTRNAVFRVSLGRGRQLAQWKVRGVPVELHLIPVAGFVEGGSLDMRGWRWRRIFLVASGPLVNIVIMLVGFWAARSWGSGADQFMFTFAPWHMLTFANLWLLIGALVPGTVQKDTGETPNDGRQLLTLLLKPLPSEQARRNSYFAGRAGSLISMGKDLAAERVLKRARRADPYNPALNTLLAMARIRDGRPEEAVRTISPVLDRFGGLSAERAVMLNVFAWAHLMIGSPENIEDAERASSEAYSLLPWQASIQITRGLALAELGWIDKAMPLLRRAWHGAFTSEARASVLCSMALVEAKGGSRDKARKVLMKAARIDPKCQLLPRVQQALQSQSQAHPVRPGLFASDTISLVNPTSGT